MLQIRTYVAPSPIHGLGLFAAEPVPRGTKIWAFTPGVDLKLKPEQLDRLPPVARDFVLKYGYLSKRSGLYVLHGDDARFTNHSAQPNLVSVGNSGSHEDFDVALRDIRPGDELTSNYEAFDADVARKLGADLKYGPAPAL